MLRKLTSSAFRQCSIGASAIFPETAMPAHCTGHSGTTPFRTTRACAQVPTSLTSPGTMHTCWESPKRRCLAISKPAASESINTRLQAGDSSFANQSPNQKPPQSLLPKLLSGALLCLSLNDACVPSLELLFLSGPRGMIQKTRRKRKDCHSLVPDSWQPSCFRPFVLVASGSRAIRKESGSGVLIGKRVTGKRYPFYLTSAVVQICRRNVKHGEIRQNRKTAADSWGASRFMMVIGNHP